MTATLRKTVYCCLLAVVFMLPFELDARSYGIALPWANTSIEVLTLAAFVLWTLLKASEREFIRPPFGLHLAAFLAYGFALALFASAEPYWSFKFMVRLSGGAFLYCLVIDTVRSPAGARGIAAALMASSVIVLVLGFAERYCLDAVSGILKAFSYYRTYLDGPEGVLRMSSTFVYANMLAMYLEMAIGAFSGLFIFSVAGGPLKGGWKSPALLALILLSVQALVFTYCRSSVMVTASVLAYLCAVAYGAVRAYGPAAFKRALVLAALAAAIYCANGFSDPATQRRLNSIADPAYAPNAQRIYIWKSAMELIREHPVSGIGPDSFRWVYAKRYAPGSPYCGINPVTPVPSVDCNNIYLETALSFGLPGAFLFFWLMLRHLVCFTKNMLLYRQEFSLSAGAGASAALLAYFMHGAADSFGSSQAITMLFWLMLGLAAVSSGCAGKGAGANENRD